VESESARNDLYNGLIDQLGADRAETLMKHLPSYDPSDVATKADLDILQSEMNTRMDSLATRMDSLATRMDRILLTLAAGLFVIFASVMSVLGVVIAVVT
jgi:hypothetical protein